jgi:hypothetical protein
LGGFVREQGCGFTVHIERDESENKDSWGQRYAG